LIGHDTLLALAITGVLLVPIFGKAPEAWWEPPLFLALFLPCVRAMFYFLSACQNKALSSVRNGVLRSQYAKSLDVTLRKSFPAPVIDVPIPGVGVAHLRFFSSRSSLWMRLQLKSHLLGRAPWLHLEGAPSFCLSAPAVGAKALTLENAKTRWRYWRLPWQQPNATVESANFCAALPPTEKTLVLTSRPGRLSIRAEGCRHGASIALRNAVRLATAWVEAVQQTNGAHAHAGLPHSQRDAPTDAVARPPDQVQ
jgi:hypothetical protein